MKSILVANRGEIALRVMRTARRLGYQTVAVCSEPDRDAPHVRFADRFVVLAGATAAETYLDVERLLDAARSSGADAVHPGYGFLSENAAFASACLEAGLIWIGPPPAAIEAMGDKSRARAAMAAAGIPCLPGASADSSEALIAEAERIGCPVMIKAAAGGGGKGMRLVSDPAELADAIVSAAREARSSFGDGALIVEKALEPARHVEIQIFADAHGNVCHLGERDCSVQRRHQKIIEESPAPGIDQSLRQAMGEAAVEVARTIDYVGAGTVEFLLGDDDRFYFLEMNTRLQVEHPVTELVTGLDLVAWQLTIAEGGKLPLTQDQISLSGHAIEARLYAEAPWRGFLPQSGEILCWQVPDDVRVDAGIDQPCRVSPHYDPLLAKIIAHGPDRESARRSLIRALARTVALGTVTNRCYLIGVLEHPEFVAGRVSTDFIERHGEELAPPVLKPRHLALAAALLEQPADKRWPEAERLTRPMRLAADCGAGEPGEHSLSLRRTGDGGCQVQIDDAEYRIDLEPVAAGSVRYRHDGVWHRACVARKADQLWLADEQLDLAISDIMLAPRQAAAEAGDGQVLAPIDGRVIALACAEGDQVTAGQVLVTIEAMKMETAIRADRAGKVVGLGVAEGDQVKSRQCLLRIEAAESGSEDD